MQDYIDLNVPCDVDYSVIESECESECDESESEFDDEDDLLDASSRDSANVTCEDSDSVFERQVAAMDMDRHSRVSSRNGTCLIARFELRKIGNYFLIYSPSLSTQPVWCLKVFYEILVERPTRVFSRSNFLESQKHE